MRERAAAQDDRIAGLDAQSRCIGGHVRARLVDHRDDAERNAHLGQLDAVGQRVALDDLADRVGEHRQRVERLGHRLEARRRQLEPVEKTLPGRPSRERPPCRLVGGQDLVLLGDKRVRHHEQSTIALLGRGDRKR